MRNAQQRHKRRFDSDVKPNGSRESTDKSAKRKIPQNILLLCVSIVFCFAVFEISASFFIKPSSDCYGELFGRELPPCQIRFSEKFHANYEEPVEGIFVDGRQITKGDMWGMLENDPAVGYAPKERTTSLNGWWKSNNVGARADEDTPRAILPSMNRIILFGDSFTNCSRVPQNETWPFYLNQKNRNTEFINFGVDGYSMCQSLMRYEIVKDKIDYDVAMLVFSPLPDLWRDINVLRQLQGWQNYPVVPRCVIANNQLQKIKGPYKSYEDLAKHNRDQMSDVLRRHLTKYDRFYFKSRFEEPGFMGKFIFFKLWMKIRLEQELERLSHKNILRMDSEAVLTTTRISMEMNEETRRLGKKFIVVFLPAEVDIRNYKNNAAYRRKYDGLVAAVKRDDILAINLMEGFSALDLKQLDTGYDGHGHYGPKTNKLIADMLQAEMGRLGIINETGN